MADAIYLGNHDFTGATLTGAGGLSVEDSAYQGSERTTTSASYVNTTLADVTITGVGKTIVGIIVQAQMKTTAGTAAIQVYANETSLGEWSVSPHSAVQPYMVNNGTTDWFTTTSGTFTAAQHLYVMPGFVTVDATTTIRLRIKTSAGTATIQGTRVRVIYG